MIRTLLAALVVLCLGACAGAPSTFSPASPAALADVGFFAIDPARGVDTAFTGPYVQIEGAVVAPPGGAP